MNGFLEKRMQNEWNFELSLTKCRAYMIRGIMNCSSQSLLSITRSMTMHKSLWIAVKSMGSRWIDQSQWNPWIPRRDCAFLWLPCDMSLDRRRYHSNWDKKMRAQMILLTMLQWWIIRFSLHILMHMSYTLHWIDGWWKTKFWFLMLGRKRQSCHAHKENRNGCVRMSVYLNEE